MGVDWTTAATVGVVLWCCACGAYDWGEPSVVLRRGMVWVMSSFDLLKVVDRFRSVLTQRGPA